MPLSDEALKNTIGVPITLNTFLKDHEKDWLRRHQYYTAVALGTSVSTVLSYPLDGIKTRMQIYHYKNFRDCVKKTYLTEGSRGFFRGCIAPLASVTVVRMMSFGFYERTAQACSRLYGRVSGHESSVENARVPGAMPTFASTACFAAGGAATGGLITFISCPFELTKLYSQIYVIILEEERKRKLKEAIAKGLVPPQPLTPPPPTAPLPGTQRIRGEGTFKVGQRIVRDRGYFGLFTGFRLHLIRDIIGSALYFGTYETIKPVLHNMSSNAPAWWPGESISILVAGALCGIASWALIYPLDSAKSQHQRNVLSRPPRVPGAPRLPRLKEPPVAWFSLSMYRGLGVSMSRSCVLNAIFFLIFENTQKRISAFTFSDGYYEEEDID